jgi:hypothetical protein
MSTQSDTAIKGNFIETIKKFVKLSSLERSHKENEIAKIDDLIRSIDAQIWNLRSAGKLVEEDFFELTELLGRFRYAWISSALKGKRVLTAVIAKTDGPWIVYCPELNVASMGFPEDHALECLKEEVENELKKKIVPFELGEVNIRFEVIEAEVE